MAVGSLSADAGCHALRRDAARRTAHRQRGSSANAGPNCQSFADPHVDAAADRDFHTQPNAHDHAIADDHTVAHNHAIADHHIVTDADRLSHPY